MATFACKIIGDGSEDNQLRPRCADVPGVTSWSGIDGRIPMTGIAGYTLVFVNGDATVQTAVRNTPDCHFITDQHPSSGVTFGEITISNNEKNRVRNLLGDLWPDKSVLDTTRLDVMLANLITQLLDAQRAHGQANGG